VEEAVLLRREAQTAAAEVADADPKVRGRETSVIGDLETGVGRCHGRTDIEIAVKSARAGGADDKGLRRAAQEEKAFQDKPFQGGMGERALFGCHGFPLLGRN
jgi:hypothetical protein